MKPSAVSILGMLLAAAGAVWLLLLVTADRTAPGIPPPAGIGADDVVAGSLTARTYHLDDTDLGTGSAEFSAVTINVERNRLMIADDQDRLYEFLLDADGLPVVPPRRVIELAFGAGDTEAIAWMYATTFVIGSENSGELAIVDIGDAVTQLGVDDVVETISTGIAEVDGSGLEGVAYLGEDGPARFAVVREKPPRIYFLGPDGAALESFALAYGIGDASDVALAPDGAITVLSDESRRVSTLVIDRDAGSVVVSRDGAIDLASGVFEQPEGLAWSPDGARLYVVGERPGPARYSFGVFIAGP